MGITEKEMEITAMGLYGDNLDNEPSNWARLGT